MEYLVKLSEVTFNSKKGTDEFTGYRRVILVEANSEDEAFKKAEAIAASEFVHQPQWWFLGENFEERVAHSIQVGIPVAFEEEMSGWDYLFDYCGDEEHYQSSLAHYLEYKDWDDLMVYPVGGHFVEFCGSVRHAALLRQPDLAPHWIVGWTHTNYPEDWC